MSLSSELFDLPASVKYDIDCLDKFELEEDCETQSYQYFADQNMKLQQENHRYGILVSQLQSQLSQFQLKCKSQQTIISSLQQQLNIQQRYN